MRKNPKKLALLSLFLEDGHFKFTPLGNGEILMKRVFQAIKTLNRNWQKKALFLCLCVALLKGATAFAGSFIYTANWGIGDGNTVGVINARTNQLITTISLGDGAPKGPGSVAVSPDGTRIYTANYGDADGSGNTVSVINARTNQLIETITIGPPRTGPGSVTVTPAKSIGNRSHGFN